MQIPLAALAPPPVNIDYALSESRFTGVNPVIDSKIRIVDLFAGCGGMSEGFTTFETQTGQRPFRIIASVGEDSACRTLRCAASTVGSGPVIRRTTWPAITLTCAVSRKRR